MTNIIEAIADRLKEVFNYDIYAEGIVEQDLITPSFFILPLISLQEPLLKERYYRHNRFDIHFFPTDASDYAEIRYVESVLYDILRTIEDKEGNKHRHSNMSAETVDNVLHFFVNYNEVWQEEKEKEKLKTIKEHTEVRNG